MKKILLLSFLLASLALPSRTALGQGTNREFSKWTVWEKAIANFERMDAANPPPQKGIEFIGSSTVVFWRSLAQDFKGMPVFNRGFGGSEIADSTHFAPRIVIPYAPRIIVLRAAVNDLWAGKSPERVFQDYQDFVATVHARLPETEIIFLGCNPTVARWSQHEKEMRVNALVEEYTRSHPRTSYVKTYDLPLGEDGTPQAKYFVGDGLHFNAEGYKLLAARLKPVLEAKWAAR